MHFPKTPANLWDETHKGWLFRAASPCDWHCAVSHAHPQSETFEFLDGLTPPTSNSCSAGHATCIPRFSASPLSAQRHPDSSQRIPSGTPPRTAAGVRCRYPKRQELSQNLLHMDDMTKVGAGMWDAQRWPGNPHTLNHTIFNTTLMYHGLLLHRINHVWTIACWPWIEHTLDIH